MSGIAVDCGGGKVASGRNLGQKTTKQLDNYSDDILAFSGRHHHLGETREGESVINAHCPC